LSKQVYASPLDSPRRESWNPFRVRRVNRRVEEWLVFLLMCEL
jgi:hypothetical protein